MRSVWLRRVWPGSRPRDARRTIVVVGLTTASAAGLVVAVAAPGASPHRAHGARTASARATAHARRRAGRHGSVLALTARSGSAGAASSAGGQPTRIAPANRYNVGAAHSPKLLQMLASQPASAAPAPHAAGSTVTYQRGVDVSSREHAHGATIDWAKVAGAGYKFAFVKATEGSYYVNPFYASDTAAARQAGLITAAYEFAIPNDSTATLQADMALDTVGDLHAGSRTLPLIIDLEYDPYVKLDHTNYCYGLSTTAMVAWISAFIAEVQRRTGTLPAIYTIQPWWQLCTGDSTAFSADPLWVAWSGTSPKMPAGWTQWEYWQYSSRTAVPGMAITSDVSYFGAANPDAAVPDTQSGAAGSAATLAVAALDAAAGQSLTWSATGLPPGTAIDPATGLISGALPAGPASYPVTVTVADAAANTQALHFAWQAHGPVTLVWPGRQSSVAGGSVSLQIHARDGLPGCSLTFTAAGLPPGLAISPCGRITGWPTRPGSYRPAIRAADSAGAVASMTIAWTVAPPLVLATGRVRLALADLCLAVPAGSTPRIWTCRKSAGQTWQVAGNGTIRVGGQCLAELSPTSNAPVLRPCTNLLSQVWQQAEGGALADVQSGRCLTDPGAGRKDGTALTLAGCDDTQRQAWTLPPVSLAVGLGPCVAGVPGSGANPAQLSLARCATARVASQAWTVAPDGTISVPGGCLTTAGIAAAPGTPVTLTACPAPGSQVPPTQRWQPMPRLGGPSGPGGPGVSGSFLVNQDAGLCLAVPAQPPAGSPLALTYCLAGYPSLTWRLG